MYFNGHNSRKLTGEASRELSKIKGGHFQNILSNSVNLEGPLLEPAR